MVPEGPQSEEEAGHPRSRDELAQKILKTEDPLRPGRARRDKVIRLLASQPHLSAYDRGRRQLGLLDLFKVRTAT